MTILEVEGVSNVRDVGGIPAKGGRIRSGVLLRSGQLSGATTTGAAALRANVQHIVDLRDGEEVAAEPTEIEAGHDAPSSVPGVGPILLRGRHQPGRPLSASPRREWGTARRGDPHHRRGERTLVHCTVGKDRTGVTVALALSAVGADREAVIADYALTESQLPVQRTQRIAEYLRTQHPEAVHAVALATQSPAPVMRRLLEQVDERWGSAAGYLHAQDDRVRIGCAVGGARRALSSQETARLASS